MISFPFTKVNWSYFSLFFFFVTFDRTLIVSTTQSTFASFFFVIFCRGFCPPLHVLQSQMYLWSFAFSFEQVRCECLKIVRSTSKSNEKVIRAIPKWTISLALLFCCILFYCISGYLEKCRSLVITIA